MSFILVAGQTKFYPITDHEDPEGAYMYNTTLSLTSVVGEGG